MNTSPSWLSFFFCLLQYLVIDAKRFVPSQALAQGLLWIIEQIPGLVVDGDATPELERGYFPSYNVPYFTEVRTFLILFSIYLKEFLEMRWE